MYIFGICHLSTNCGYVDLLNKSFLIPIIKIMFYNCIEKLKSPRNSWKMDTLRKLYCTSYLRIDLVFLSTINRTTLYCVRELSFVVLFIHVADFYLGRTVYESPWGHFPE